MQVTNGVSERGRKGRKETAAVVKEKATKNVEAVNNRDR